MLSTPTLRASLTFSLSPVIYQLETQMEGIRAPSRYFIMYWHVSLQGYQSASMVVRV
jgi:hypothetical protein